MKKPCRTRQGFAVLAGGGSLRRPRRWPDRGVEDYSAATIETVCLFNAPLKPN